jgi:nucleotide-binding universal stress UspA family protein
MLQKTDGRIVVGVDGSAAAQDALAWAIVQAQHTGAVVEAVIAWDYPTAYGHPVPFMYESTYPELAERVLATAIAAIPAELSERAEIRPRLAEGGPARVLLDAAEGADLLVVGSRGHSGFVEALLGSVGQNCVHHAVCPVVVVRHQPAARPEGDDRHAG